MGWLLFESLVALVILVAIVAWTMSSRAGGRRGKTDDSE